MHSKKCKFTLSEECFMKCPNCGTRNDFSTSQVKGYSENPLKECLGCGHSWIVKDGKINIIRQGVINNKKIAA